MKDLLDRPLFSLTGREFLELQKAAQQPIATPESKTEKYVYGLGGLARHLGCSTNTAGRIKRSGIIDKAITQIGRTIVVDADLVLQLAQTTQPFNRRKA